MTPAQQLAQTRAAVRALAGTAAGRDVWMSGPAADLGGGVPIALVATGRGEPVLECVPGRAAGQARGEPAGCGHPP